MLKMCSKNATNSTSTPSSPTQAPRPTQLAQRRQARSNVTRVIALSILALIVIVGLAVLIAWLIINPKQLLYTIEDGSIKNFTLTNDHLNATYDFLIKAHNPNKRISIYYDTIEVAASYGSQTIAFNTLAPFYQRRHNVTELDAMLVSRDLALPSSLSRDMRREAETSNIKLAVRLKAKTRYKVGVIKLRRRTTKILCSPVTVHFNSSKSFERVYCDLDY